MRSEIEKVNFQKNRNVLVVDDDTLILERYREILEPESDSFINSILSDSTDSNVLQDDLNFSIDTADQGHLALQQVKRALMADEHYAVVFLDMRMPPGWDGAKTAKEIRKLDPNLLIVIVTAFSDSDIRKLRIELGGDVLFMRKPFESDELYLLASFLCESWDRHHFNDELIFRLKDSVDEHKKKQQELEQLTDELSAANVMQSGLQEEIRQKVDELAKIAVHDELTGLLNRRGFNERMAQELDRANREKGHLALLYLDLDGFKPVNDNIGHTAGDEVLKVFSKRLLDTVRKYDLAFRIGGDEFAVLLINIHDLEVVKRLVDRIIEQTKKAIVVDEQEVVIGVSVGVALFPEHAVELEGLIQIADNAMYQAKEEGKGRFVIASLD